MSLGIYILAFNSITMDTLKSRACYKRLSKGNLIFFTKQKKNLIFCSCKSKFMEAKKANFIY